MQNLIKKLFKPLTIGVVASVLLGIGIGVLPQYAFAAYSYQRTITIDHTKVSTNDQINFPVLVCYNSTPGIGSCPTDAGLNQTGGGAHVQNSNGYDMVYSSTPCTSPTLMSWEPEKYVASTGERIDWVLLPTISHTVDTVFYLCYGNAAISTFQGGASSSVWSPAGYQGVWHFKGSLGLTDSSGNGNTLAVGGASAATGQFDGGATSPGTAPSGVVVNATPVNLYANTFTYSMWVNPTAFSTHQVLIGSGNHNLAIDDTSGHLQIQIPTSNSYGNAQSNNELTTGAWQYVVATYTSGGSPQIYVNGTEVTYSAQGPGNGTVVTDFNSFGMGAQPSNYYAYPFDGLYDEPRMSTTAFTSDWIATEYNNQSSPSTFFTVGAETTPSAGGVSVPHVQAVFRGRTIFKGREDFN